MVGCTRCPAGTNTCPRCSTRICFEHVPFAGDACAECELVYQESREELHMPAWFMAGFALPWLALFALAPVLPSWAERSGGARAITTGVPMVDVLLMTMICAVFAGKAVIGLRSWWHRRGFMSRSLPRARTRAT